MHANALLNQFWFSPPWFCKTSSSCTTERKKERKKDRFRNPFFRFDRKFVSTMDKFMVTLLNALLISLTVIANVFVLAAMIKTPSLRSPSNIVFCIGIGQYMSSILYCWRVRKQLLSKQAEEN